MDSLGGKVTVLFEEYIHLCMVSTNTGEHIAMLCKRYALLSLFFCLITLSGCNDNTEEPRAPIPLKVVAVEVVTANLPMETTFNATLAAKETVEVRSRISGYLKERLFAEGTLVTEGDVIYKLDDRDLAAKFATTQANTAKAKATWENDEVTKDRYIPLASKGVVSVQDRDNYVAKAAESLAQYKATQAQEEQAAVNLSYATIIAPITGYINRSQVDVGGYVQAGEALLTTIYRINPIRAEFSITDREFAQLRKMMTDRGGDPKVVTFRLELDGQHIAYPHAGVLEMADPVVDSRTNTMGVRAAFPNPDHLLRPGLFVNVIGSVGERAVLTVPEIAVFDQGNGKAVYVVDDKNILVATPVTIGRLVGENRVVESGLTGGQKVVVEGLVAARPGATVEIIFK